MPRYQWIISLFVVWHLVSLGVSSIASPADLDRYQTDAGLTYDGVSRRLRPTTDVAASVLNPVSRALWWASTPARFLTAPYSQAVSLRQRWRMFVRPTRHLTYLRLRYYWQNPDDSVPGQTLTTDELVFPRDREDKVRLVASYRNRFHNKAVSNALAEFLDDRRNGLAAYSRHLKPLSGHFRDRFERGHLASNASVFRAELWYGVVPIPPPGQRVPVATATRHREAVASYYGQIAPRAVPGNSYPARESVERQVDITWSLIDIEETP